MRHPLDCHCAELHYGRLLPRLRIYSQQSPLAHVRRGEVSAVIRISETEAVVKGQTASKSFKPATLENGVRVMVPPFVGPDEEIVVNTETMEYSERA